MVELNEQERITTTETQNTHSQYLSFVLFEETYGIDILRIEEIKGWEKVTRIPNSPRYVKGILNLRGAIVPIYDLRQRFNLPVIDYSNDTVVIVMRVKEEGRDRSVGIVVDGVSDVVDARSEDISRTPDFGVSVPIETICGLITTNEHMVILLDVDKLLVSKPVALVEAANDAT